MSVASGSGPRAQRGQTTEEDPCGAPDGSTGVLKSGAPPNPAKARTLLDGVLAFVVCVASGNVGSQEIIAASQSKGPAMTTHLWTPDTAEMPLWHGDEDGPNGTYTWGVYSDLGAFRPRWGAGDRLVPYAHRVDHTALHTVHAAGLRKGRLGKWVRSVAREISHRVATAFVQVGEFA